MPHHGLSLDCFGDVVLLSLEEQVVDMGCCGRDILHLIVRVQLLVLDLLHGWPRHTVIVKGTQVLQHLQILGKEGRDCLPRVVGTPTDLEEVTEPNHHCLKLLGRGLHLLDLFEACPFDFCCRLKQSLMRLCKADLFRNTLGLGWIVNWRWELLFLAGILLVQVSNVDGLVWLGLCSFGATVSWDATSVHLNILDNFGEVQVNSGLVWGVPTSLSRRGIT